MIFPIRCERFYVCSFIGDCMRQRRTVIKAIGAATTGGVLAGCVGDDEDEDQERPGPDEDQEYERVGPIEMPSLSRDFESQWVDGFNRAVDDWEELGIEIELNTMEVGPWITRLEDRDFEIIADGRDGEPERIDPGLFINDLYRVDDPAASNFSYWGFEGAPEEDKEDAEEYTDLAIESNSETDRERRQELIYECQRLFSEAVPDLYQWYITELAAYSEESDNWDYLPSTNPLGNTYTLSQIETDKDTIIWGTTQEMPTLNYATYAATGERQQIQGPIYDTLLAIGPDGLPYGSLAEDWEWIDERTIEVTLKEGQTFHDGEPITSEDIQWNFEWNEEWEIPSHIGHVGKVENVETIDDLTAQIILESPDVAFEALDLVSLPIAPKHVWDGITEREDLEHPGDWDDIDYTGSGPMIVQQFDPPETVVYEVHEDHWQNFSFDEYIVTLYGGSGPAVGALEAGDVDFVQNITPTDFERLEDEDGIGRLSVETVGYRKARVNCNHEPFNDRVLRQAFFHAEDTSDISAVALGGMGAPGLATPIAPVNEFWHNPDIETYEGGVDEAVEILREAGYRWDEDGQLLKPTDRVTGDPV